jgi:predicted nucleic acid-binding protein
VADYVALARELHAKLATTDERLAAAAKTARVPLWEDQ